MTLTVTDIVAGPFTLTGVADVLPYAFLVFTDDEIEVVQIIGNLETVIDPSDYTVDINTNLLGQAIEGGTVTYTGTVGDFVELRAKPSFTQDQVFTLLGFRPPTLNEMADRAAIRDLRLALDITRTPTYEIAAEAGAAAAEAVVALKQDKNFAVSGRPVSSTVADRFAVVIDVKHDFGAVGDNAADDLVALTAAFNDANSAADSSPFPIGLFFPGGVYKYTARLPDLSRSVFLFSHSPREAVLAPVGNFDAVSFKGTQVGGRVASAGIRNLALNGAGSTGGFAIAMDYGSDLSFADLLVSNFLNLFSHRQCGDVSFTRMRVDGWRGDIGWLSTGSMASRNGSNDQSDVVNFSEVTIEGIYEPGVTPVPKGDAFVFNGHIHTVDFEKTKAINCRSGLTLTDTFGLAQADKPSIFTGRVETENTWIEGHQYLHCNDVSLAGFAASAISQACVVVGDNARDVKLTDFTCSNGWKEGIRVEAGAIGTVITRPLVKNCGQAISASAPFAGINDLSGKTKVVGGGRIGAMGSEPTETQQWAIKGVTGTFARDIDLSGNVVAALSGDIYATNCKGVAPVAPVTLLTGSSGTASPYLYTAGLRPTEVSIAGGTVTSVTLNGVVLYNAIANASVTLKPGDSVSIAYSSEPVVRANYL